MTRETTTTQQHDNNESYIYTRASYTHEGENNMCYAYAQYRAIQQARQKNNKKNGYTPASVRVRTLREAVESIECESYKVAYVQYLGVDWGEGDGFNYYVVVAQTKTKVAVWLGLDRHEHGEARFILDGGNYAFKDEFRKDELLSWVAEHVRYKVDRYAPNLGRVHGRD